MNKQKWDALPADIQKVFNDHSTINLAAKFGRSMDEGDARAKALIAKTNSISVLSASETASWMARGDELRNEWITKAANNGLDGAGLVAKAKALIAKYSNQ